LNGTKERNVVVADGGKREMKVGRGDCCEISVKVPFASVSSALVKVRATPDGEEAVHIWYDAAAKELVMDTTRMKDGFKPAVERAPFELAEGETLDLDVFVDRRIVEVFANGRQAISRFACPKSTEALGVVLSAKDGPATYGTVEVWELAPTNPY
jgi:sucrose-6-phosphate hydrolase SacC (GH32 family)